MGNRAVVSVEGSKVGVYLHWNGGIESVEAFLRAAKQLGVRDPVDDESYFLARFVQIIGNFFGGTTSVGVGLLESMDRDNGDNGHFIVGKKFKITGRQYASPEKLDVERSYAIYKDVIEANKSREVVQP